MNAVKKFLGLFQDSPTYDRDRANLISAGTIGFTALLLNGAVLLTLMPLMLDTNDRDFRMLTENIEFGQLLGLILCGGMTAFATLLIPLRLTSVLLAPRVGRYFDQIVLSGIAPLRFLIGKVLSQNLYFALILVLLAPWFVLVLALGGVQWTVFFANLFLVWLYCMTLALVTLWLSLYVNEILSAFGLIYLFAVLCGIGCIPMEFNPFIVTPFPALMQTVYDAVGVVDVLEGPGYFATFVCCLTGMSVVAIAALCAIYLGPLYGILRDNSTFGEVVRSGDSRRKRRFRLRMHIQRPSEITFFYENRGEAFKRWEGLLRWGLPCVVLLLAMLVACGTMFWLSTSQLTSLGRLTSDTANQAYWIAEEFVVFNHMIHAWTLLIAAFLFSHSRNSTLMKLPFAFGRRVTVATLDTVCFVAFLLLSTTAAIGLPMVMDLTVGAESGFKILQTHTYYNSIEVNFRTAALGSTLTLALCGCVIYALHRYCCLFAWLRISSFATVALCYGFLVCILPVPTALFMHEFARYSDSGVIADVVTWLSGVTPIFALADYYENRPPGFPPGVARVACAAGHVFLLIIALRRITATTQRLRGEYLAVDR